MTWIIEDNGRARFGDERTAWQLGTDPARPEAGLWIDRRLDPAATAAVSPSVRMLPPPGQTFPPLAEVYSRGQDLIASLPQTDGSEFGLSLCHRVVRCTPELVVCETIVTIQTDLLDSHPTLDLVSDAAGRPLPHLESGSGESGSGESGSGESGSGESGSGVSGSGESGSGAGDEPLITAASRTRGSVAPPLATRLDESPRSSVCVILLPPSDRAVAEDRSTAASTSPGSPVCYRLLAEFLEKGVIRKARYWTCRWADEPSEAAVAEVYRELLHIPLPLTP